MKRMTETGFITTFGRPWDFRMLRELALELRASGAVGKPKIRHLTMWTSVARALTREIANDEEVVLVTELLQSAEVCRVPDETLQGIDGELFRTLGSRLKTMFECERYRPAKEPRRDEFLRAHAAALSRAIPESGILLSNAVDHYCYWLACDLTRVRGGEYFGFCASGRPSGRTQVMRGAREMWTPFASDRDSEQEVERQRKDVEMGVLPDYMIAGKHRVSVRSKFNETLCDIVERRAGNYFVSGRGVLPGRAYNCFSGMRWKMEKRRFAFVRSVDELVRPFVYLALHFEPEASTSVYCPFARDQSVWVESVAKSLPVGVVLAVKENPKMLGRRPSGFYQRIEKLPEVMLVSPEVPSNALIRKSCGVLSLTGTVAIEARLFRRPVMLFGEPPFAGVIRSIQRVDSMAELPRRLDELIRQRGIEDDPAFAKEYAHYIANLLPCAFRGTTNADGGGIYDTNVEYSSKYLAFVIAALGGATTEYRSVSKG